MREATNLYHTLVRRHPDTFQPDLAGSSNDMGVILNQLGQLELAIAPRARPFIFAASS
jgi:hypothetical protein